MTVEEILARITKTLADARKAFDAGDKARAIMLVDQAELLTEVAQEKAALTRGKYFPKLPDKAMTDAHREAISKGRMRGGPNMRAARAAGYRTSGELALALGVKPSFLSKVFSGDKPMPPERAAKFRELTGKDWE